MPLKLPLLRQSELTVYKACYIPLFMLQSDQGGIYILTQNKKSDINRKN